MAPASLTLHAPTTSFPFATGAGGRSRPHWAPPAVPAPLPPAAMPAVPRRLLLPAAAGIWDFISGGAGGAAAASLAVRRGMQLFRQGDVAGSLTEFDSAIEMDPRQKQYLWQRGLSLYYLDRFEEGAEQFRLDVAANPNDTEESIWCFLCEAQLYGVEEARKQFLEVGLDSRPVMREAYALFKDGGDPEKTFRVALVVTSSIPHYMLDFTTNLGKMQIWQNLTLLQLASHHMDQGLAITWLR
ncbi:uncharacterized protein LOC133911756 isoform X3 [Phragmites australis]|uniref:uncharacterized protein LOC133911756 isoform X3 n=1 Tax=Phragmites australis TaxID=29695 RepID=UPI002D796B2C|nr:uncharacterized protein LOC133911756 isoform X3 [Phragmites australis]